MAQDFNHPGPAIVHLSKVPEGQDVTTYDGSGEWVKIHSSGMKIGKNGTYSWPLYNVMGLDIPRVSLPDHNLSLTVLNGHRLLSRFQSRHQRASTSCAWMCRGRET